MKKTLVFGATIKLAKENRNGIMKKVFAEARVLSSEYDVYIWGFTDNSIIYFHEETSFEVTKFANKRERRIKYFNEITRFCIEKKASVFYFRYASSDFFLLRSLRMMKKAGITNLIEVPTYPYEGEFKDSIKKQLILLLDRILRPLLKRYVSGAVVFMGNYKKLFGIPTILTMNGIDFDEIELVKNQELRPIRMVEVSTMLPHHGCDRIIKGIAQYINGGGQENIHLSIVGDGPECEKYKSLVKSCKVEAFVDFCGRQDGSQLRDIFDNSNVAVGSLGLHRIGIQNASTLKAREYIARGLPVVYSTSDPLMDANPYCFNCPADDSPIDIKSVLVFLERIYKEKDINSKIRHDGKRICDMNVTMLPILNFLKKSGHLQIPVS